MSTVHCLVLSQSTHVTDGQTDRQNYDSQDRASIAARAVKTVKTSFTFLLNVIVFPSVHCDFVTGLPYKHSYLLTYAIPFKTTQSWQFSVGNVSFFSIPRAGRFPVSDI